MRKPPRLSPEDLAPFVWELPPAFRGMWNRAVPADATPAPIDWSTLFGNANPVEIEVGFGKGLFLVTTATARPGVNLFGVEIVRKYQMYAANRTARRKLTNVRTCCGDAKLVLRHFVQPASVAAVHVYFPDPWWKTRHRKRLLVTPEFAELVVRVLRPGGRLHFVTDVADYFAIADPLFAATPGLVRQPPPPETEPAHDMDYLTNFERKFRKEGRPIHRALYEKA